MMRTTMVQAISVLMVGAWIASCGGGNFTPSEAAQSAEEVSCSSADIDQTIEMKNTSFSPDSTRIEPGDVVKWVNRDSFPHDVTNGNEGGTGAFESGEIAPDESYCLEFPKSGTVQYVCTIHGAGTMSGKLGVGQEPSANSGSSAGGNSGGYGY
ncbi:MAG: plastocyanin/azurin family copper-binding protein [Bradymonadaceae bacterium]